ncbi:MAG: hypothetical protein O2954_04495, partial [bacterium]|nr:hypothetical protein [bacterium]
SGAFPLRTIPIHNNRLSFPVQAQETALLTFTAHIPPVTPEPGNHGQRLRGRRFPLDFTGRMIEGPRDQSRLYFYPSLLLQPEEIESPPGVQALMLSQSDIKALGSALQSGDKAILIPPSPAPDEVLR